MDWIRRQYAKDYAPNTRETVRRFTLHQFAEALLVEQNPDQPDRPVNSPKWSYQVNVRALEAIRKFEQPGYKESIQEYIRAAPGLKMQYDAARELNRIPVTLPGGAIMGLSPGGQNVLIKQMVEDFCAYFTPGGQVLYIGDADAKWAVFRQDALEELGYLLISMARCPIWLST
jgi:BsuBI/PstI restriction endonuclease HTH domain/BsuBI/PstI restriction endonuclease domain